MNFYQFSQNNSGGSFDVDSKLCHNLFIEAKDEESAIAIAEDLGCYWDGVEKDMDCDCCGDRWYRSPNKIDLNSVNEKWGGYEVSKYIKDGNELKELISEYSDYAWIESPKILSKYGSDKAIGRLRIDNIEQYAKVMANLYGWTKPDCRIFYADGTVKEIYSSKLD